MFQSIDGIDYFYSYKNKVHLYTYKIKDSNFISTATITVVSHGVAPAEISTAVLIKEYESRNYDHKEIVANLFIFNLFALKQNWGFQDVNHLLEYQHHYLTKKDFPEINFREKYYNDLVKYTKKMMVVV